MEHECVFCNRNNFSENLIAECGGSSITASLGQITNGGYLLIIPNRHVACLGALRKKEIRPFAEVTYQALMALSSEYNRELARIGFWSFTVFEHGIVGQTIKHAHLHILPISINLTERIRCDFPSSKFEKIERFRDLQRKYSKNPMPYLFWGSRTKNGEAMVCWDPPAPPQYLRTITAEMLGRSERADWRKMNADLDKKLRGETIQKMKKHFIAEL